MKSLLLSFLTLFSLFTIADVPGVNCQSYSSGFLGHSVGYCVHRSHNRFKSEPTDKVVYFFHGLQGSSKHWAEAGYAEVVDTLSQKENFPKTTFIAFDTSGMSFFSNYGNKNTGGDAYETWLIREFIPFIEKKLGIICQERNCRGTVGVSMGGYGAIKTALKYPDLFSTAAANCPALVAMNLYDSYKEWKAYFNRHPIGSFKGGFFLQAAKGIFPTREYFDANNPIIIADEIAPIAAVPALYFDVGGKDYYGFQEGYQAFKRVLDKRGIPYKTRYEPEKGHEISVTTRWDAIGFLRDTLR